MVAVEENNFDLYVDRSHARYLSDWLLNAGEDPITRVRNTARTVS
jgi:sarcosine oxidase gamma subunit